MILTGCSISLFSLVLKQAMVQNLFIALIYCDFPVILVHQKLYKEKKQIEMLFNSPN